MSDSSIANIDEGQDSKPEVKVLAGWYLILLPLVIGGVVGFFYAFGLGSDRFMKFWDMRYIGNDLVDYLEGNKQFSAEEKWCDVLHEASNTFDNNKYYRGSDESFPYALNKHVIGYEKIPDNMVVLFTGVEGWNIVGDYELVKDCSRIRVFLGSGEIRTYRKYQIPSLRWKHEDSGIIAKRNIKIPLTVMSVLLAIVVSGILIVCRASIKTFWLLAFVVAIGSAVAGGFFGIMAEGFYYKTEIPGGYISPWIGGVWGFVIGAIFIFVLGEIFRKYHGHVSMVGYGTVFGAVTGIIASSIVHGYMMIWYGEESFAYMLAGSSFGIIAGLLLGWVSSGLIHLYKNHPAVVGINVDDNN